MIRHMYFTVMRSLPMEYWSKMYPRDPDYSKGMARVHENNFYNEFLSKVDKSDYFIFILTKDQIEQICGWDWHVQHYGLNKYIVYEQKEFSYNTNHPNSGPRLKMFVLHFPEGYKE